MFPFALLLFMSVSISSCDKLINDCADYACFTPPQPIFFQLYNDIDQDLLAADYFDLSKLEVKIVSSDESIRIDSIRVEGQYYLFTEKIGWEQGVSTYRFSYREEVLFDFQIEAKQVSENCCTFTEYEGINLSIESYEQLNDNNVGIVYRIFVAL
jgi:hypothetical protein